MAETPSRTRQFRTAGLMTGLLFTVYAHPSLAGFQFDAAPAAPPQSMTPAPSQPYDGAPDDSAMLAMPAPAVNAEPIDMQASPMQPMPAAQSQYTGGNDSVLPPAGSVSCGPQVSAQRTQPLERQQTMQPARTNTNRRAVSHLQPAQNEAVNTQALYDAVESGEPLALSADSQRFAGTNTPGRLVINPYPLQGDGATNDSGMGQQLPEDQAMIEQGGSLRPVAVPGRTGASGMIQRAAITARYNPANDRSADQYARQDMAQPMPQSQQMASYNAPDGMTPIPGGEGAPLPSDMQAAPMQQQAMQQQAPRMPRGGARRQGGRGYPAAQPDNMLRIPAEAGARQQAQQMPIVPMDNASGNGEYTSAVGFGRDLPLALALSQVVPPGYSYAFGNNVNTGANVSWQGGKPWDQVLNEMLAPSGMKAVISGKQVTIQKA